VSTDEPGNVDCRVAVNGLVAGSLVEV